MFNHFLNELARYNIVHLLCLLCQIFHFQDTNMYYDVHKFLLAILLNPLLITIGEQKVYFYFFKRPERYTQEVLSHPFICLPLPYMEGIVLICNIDLFCAIAIFNGTADVFNR